MGATTTQHNAHMTNHGYNGVRIGVMIAGEDFYVRMGINWDNLMDQVTSYEYGNTIFPEHVIVPIYFKNAFRLQSAGIELGYSKTAYSATASLQFRLCRMNPQSFISLAMGLFKAGMLTVDDISGILEAPFKHNPKHKRRGYRVYNGAVYRFYAKALVTSAITKWGEEEAIKKLKISKNTFNYWLTEKVKDIRVKPTSSRRVNND